MKINLMTPILSTDGYSAHGRQLFKALNELGCDVKLSTNLPSNWETMVSDAELNAIQKTDTKDRVVIMNSLPNTWYNELVKNHKAFYGYCVWEGDRIPKSWIPILIDPRVTGILVPSEHTKQAILNTFEGMIYEDKDGNMFKIENNDWPKVHVIPHGVDHSIFYPEENKDKEPEKLTFLCNSGWRGGLNDRKGVPYLIKAYLEEFKKEDKVKLILKINPAYCPRGWTFENECEKIGIKRNTEQAEIFVSAAPLEYKALRSFFNMGDIIVSPTMADAFNLPLLEGMACELPVITTDYGGQTDFVNDKNGWLLKEGNMEEVSDEILYEGIKWKRPNIEEIRKALRYAYEHKDEVKVKGKQAEADSKNFMWRNSAKKIMEILS